MRQLTYVVGTDLSPPSRAGLESAALLASRTGAKLDLFCAVPPTAARERGFTDRVAGELDRIAQRAGGEAGRRHVVVASDAAAALARHARNVGADLLVVAPRGDDRRRRGLGSVTERVLRLAPALLLVARGRMPASADRILAAVDRTPGSSRALRVAVDLARATGAKVVALHVVPGLGAALAGAPAVYLLETLRREAERVAQARREFTRWVREFPKDGVDVEARVVTGHPVETILEEARAASVPLVVVGSHGKTALHEFFVGSVAHGVVANCPSSVLVVRNRPGKRLRALPDLARRTAI